MRQSKSKSTTLFECPKCGESVDASFSRDIKFNFTIWHDNNGVISVCPDCLLKVWDYARKHDQKKRQ